MPPPSTPIAQTYPISADTAPTGTWRHPRFDEIARRQNRATFTDRNFRTIIWNTSVLLGTWGVRWAIERSPWLATLFKPVWGYAGWPLFVLRLIFLLNILLALRPVLAPKDDLSDIPLTPSQRALLGLDPLPKSASTTPSSAYITPPRYPQSTTPRNGSPGSRSSPLSGSPLAGKGAALQLPGRRASPLSTNGGSLMQKAFNEDPLSRSRRASFNTPSLLGAGSGALDNSGVSLPSSPTPSRKPASLTLNNKWLYERGRGGVPNGKLYL